jgi:hypothetical protein
MPKFILRWAINGDKGQLEMDTAKEAVQKAQEVMADGAEDISITNPEGETFEIDYFTLVTKDMDRDQ